MKVTPTPVPKRSACIGIMRLAVWPIIEETPDGIVYDTVVPLTKTLMNASDTPSTAGGELCADNQVVTSTYSKTGGELAIGVTAHDSADRVVFYGETIQKGTNVTNKDDVSPSVCVAYAMNCADGTLKLKKFPRCTFSEGAETAKTQEKEGIEYSTISMTGKYSPTLHNGDARYIRHSVDPKRDKDIIEKWFTDPEYYGPEEVVAPDPDPTPDPIV